MALLPKDVQDSINSQLGKEIGIKLEKIAMVRFEILKEKMMQAFESHPVTQEIESGPNSSNTSGTLSGYGNLFTFIGFPSGHDPILPIRERLQESRLAKINIKRGIASFLTTEPTREELFSMTKFSNFRNDFEGSRSWLDGIETGISGLGYYLYRAGKNIEGSRSGPSIQLKSGKKSESAFGEGDTGGATAPQRSRYTRVSYVSKILKEFKIDILKLNREIA
jgi:hypothetical protein|tara:strand:+ start:391 stop:1056 length:666 start_codon:yes stop_codon:yes gene_type:complete